MAFTPRKHACRTTGDWALYGLLLISLRDAALVSTETPRMVTFGWIQLRKANTMPKEKSGEVVCESRSYDGVGSCMQLFRIVQFELEGSILGGCTHTRT